MQESLVVSFYVLYFMDAVLLLRNCQAKCLNVFRYAILQAFSFLTKSYWLLFRTGPIGDFLPMFILFILGRVNSSDAASSLRN